MPRLILKIALLITIVLLTIQLATHSFGSIRSVHPTLRGFTEGCADHPQPCWYGIIPAVTTLESARSQLEHYQYPLDCVNLLEAAGIVTQINLRPCDSLPTFVLGDAIAQLGAIDGTALIPDDSGIVANVDTVVFRNAYVTANLSYTTWRLHRWQSLLALTLDAEPITKIDFKWYGVVRTWRLCQLEPNHLVCGFCSLKSSIEVYDANNICQ